MAIEMIDGPGLRRRENGYLLLGGLVAAHAIFWPLFLRRQRQRRESLQRAAGAIASAITRDFPAEVESWGGREVLDGEATVEELIQLVRRAI